MRIADITLEDFCKNLNEHFKTAISFLDFVNIFNSMAQVDEQSLERISEFKRFLDENSHIKFLLISHTNFSHLNYILAQIESRLPECRSGVIDITNTWAKETQVLFAPSMSSKCPDHPSTLKYAIAKLEIGATTPLVSFLNTIKTFEEHQNFRYIDAGPTLNHKAITEKLNEIHESITASIYEKQLTIPFTS
ncbi:hypothetical protein [Legionella lansingensis]|uniref:hypothetical protein n=1 Tax=Legionella lansingensis TaxID=45067 RepID=UPI00104115F6|nr:hypothetical protein [Legionella lansingensis]